MITEDIIRESYIKSIVRRDANIIYTTQANVIQQNFSGDRAERLKSFLLTKPFSSEGAPGKEIYHFRVFIYLRYLDIQYSNRRAAMSQRRSLALYNRVIWGVLYHETLPALRYGLTQDIRNRIKAELESSTNR